MGDEGAVDHRLRAFPRVVVNDHRLGVIEDAPALLPHPVAPVDVLEVEKEPLVEKPHRLDRLPADEQTGAEYPVHLAGRGVVEVEHHVTGDRGRLLEDLPEDRPAQHQDLPRVEPPAGVLERPVSVHELGADDPGRRRPCHEIEELLDRIGLDHGIRVEDQEEIAARLADPDVHAARKAHVLAPGDQRDPGIALPHHRRSAVRARVVDDDHFGFVEGVLFLERIETGAEHRAAVVADDDDGYFQWRISTCAGSS